ncbi:hypothetical protein NKH73_02035 [Mesorhizobium sp. M0938]|uniref:hypothetical protein n=1 Tax=unclassified Mesorhizobium TaxID=325217 RepID=UPI0033381A6C
MLKDSDQGGAAGGRKGPPPLAEILRRVEAATKHFKKREIRKKVVFHADATRDWLLRNDHRYDADNSLEAGQWWPHDALGPLGPNGHRISRLFQLIARGFENGLRNNLERLRNDAALLCRENFLDKALSYKAMGIYFEQYGLSVANRAPEPLAKVAKRFGYAKNQDLRDYWVPSMVELGLWSARYHTAQWAIELGPVAKAYHERAFWPAFKVFEPTIEGDRK